MTQKNGKTYYALYHGWGNGLKLSSDIQTSPIVIAEEQNNCVVLRADNPDALTGILPRRKSQLSDYGVSIVESSALTWFDKPVKEMIVQE